MSAPRSPSSTSSPSPGGTLRREGSKKEAVLGWMGTLTRRKKASEIEVNELEAEGKNAIDSPTTPSVIIPDSFVLEEDEERSMVEPGQLLDDKVRDLVEILLDWINDELSSQRIVLKNLEEDLYDGQILAILLEKLGGMKLKGLPEVTHTVQSQKAKLAIILEHVSKILKVPLKNSKWSVERVHNKDIVAILHLLVALAKHFNCPKQLPDDVSINVVVVKKQGGLLHSNKVKEEITAPEGLEETDNERDAFDALFDHAPEKLSVVKKSLQTFVNRHLEKLNLEVTDLDNQFHDGVYLIFLMGLLEGYFVPLYQFHVTPAGLDQKIHNVNLVLELMHDAGITRTKAKADDVVNHDLKSTLRILYLLFQKYKHVR